MNEQKADILNKPHEENFQKVLEYENGMLIFVRCLLGKNLKIESDILQQALQRALENALVESMLIHIRILCEIYLSQNKSYHDGITLNKILNNKEISTKLRELIKELKKTYGDSRIEGSHRWIINKMLAHPSELRGSTYNYRETINQLFPILLNIIKEINMILKNPEIEEFINIQNKVILI